MLAVAQLLGLVLPWFGPMGGLFVISPIIEMNILESRWITRDTQCFVDAVNVCNDTSQYQYYFWNITNPDEVMLAGRHEPHPSCLHLSSLRCAYPRKEMEVWMTPHQLC